MWNESRSYLNASLRSNLATVTSNSLERAWWNRNLFGANSLT
jgi:hypothetical protein